MTYTQQDYEAADREQQERNYIRAEEERERAEALECRIEDGFARGATRRNCAN